MSPWLDPSHPLAICYVLPFLGYVSSRSLFPSWGSHVLSRHCSLGLSSRLQVLPLVELISLLTLMVLVSGLGLMCGLNLSLFVLTGLHLVLSLRHR
ncbi:uncharacterized protein LAESUDRAFT_195296 [Laetiporus sulphureus 93-53]|uniref:Uncharacterized protein n=1 Tax=Laetiporus sulphureus 93-53 TaxID=1314785 RepID=A0A165E134_9APHY|nr:uncharacterized protein LAESUDRAFT_195296 [Laetiporus sulphureus 93-53]KZT06047.1 hypothetical protein LAESUDRAFT_195296 [Laetiporus sulphureus 93-53]